MTLKQYIKYYRELRKKICKNYGVKFAGAKI